MPPRSKERTHEDVDGIACASRSAGCLMNEKDTVHKDEDRCVDDNVFDRFAASFIRRPRFGAVPAFCLAPDLTGCRA
jgi:hypothetical protein